MEKTFYRPLIKTKFNVNYHEHTCVFVAMLIATPNSLGINVSAWLVSCAEARLLNYVDA